MLLILTGLVVVAALVGFGVLLARSSKKTYAEQHELIPGQASNAPIAWAGAHTPEARMHRRLGAAVRGVHATSDAIGSTGGASDARLLEMRVELEQQAVQVDAQLIAAAQLPAEARAQRIAQLEGSVVALEAAAADLSSLIAGGAASSTQAVQDLAERIRIASEVRRELEAIDRPELPKALDVDGPGQSSAEDDEGGARGRGTPGTA